MEDTLAVDWEARFRAETTPWERPALSPAFTAWLADGTLTPCRILVPGAGRSPEPLALAKAGFEVTIVDAAPSAVAEQRRRFAAATLPGTIEEADLFAWTPARRFAAIYDQTCLCALKPALWAAYAERLASWLEPGGRLFALFMQTGKEGGPPFHSDVATMRGLFAPPVWTWPPALPPAVAHSLGLTEQPAVLRRA